MDFQSAEMKIKAFLLFLGLFLKNKAKTQNWKAIEIQKQY